jgi:hypothetical protein
MTTRAADDFPAIRARMGELKRERERAARRPAWMLDEESADKVRWRIDDRLREKVFPRRSAFV